MNSWTMGFKSNQYRYNFNPQQTRHARDKLHNSFLEFGTAQQDEAKLG